MYEAQLIHVVLAAIGVSFVLVTLIAVLCRAIDWLVGRVSEDAPIELDRGESDLDDTFDEYCQTQRRIAEGRDLDW